jgi:hypothetical protein
MTQGFMVYDVETDDMVPLTQERLDELVTIEAKFWQIRHLTTMVREELFK